MQNRLFYILNARCSGIRLAAVNFFFRTALQTSAGALLVTMLITPVCLRDSEGGVFYTFTIGNETSAGAALCSPVCFILRFLYLNIAITLLIRALQWT